MGEIWSYASRSHRSTAPTGVFEVSRFSCMKFLGVPGVFGYAGLNKNSR
jgi:hypothetical protein